MTSIRSISRIAAGRIHRAFSLIELMVVVTLIAILTVSISVNIRGAQEDHALKLAAEDLAAAIRFGFEESRLKGVTHRISFANGSTGYRIESATGNVAQPYRPVCGIAGVYRHFTSGIRIKTINPPNANSGYGAYQEILCVSPGGFDGEIILCNRRGDTVKLKVLAGTGQVYVET